MKCHYVQFVYLNLEQLIQKMNISDNNLLSSTHSSISNKDIKSPNQKVYSLMPDLVTGWKPKNIKIPSPIIIKYKDKLITLLLQFYKDEPQKIIYRGPRYSNSIKFHQKIEHEYNLKYGITSDDIPLFFQNQLKQEENKDVDQASYQGMNPIIKSNIMFQSAFQSGNLDMVIKCGENQYNLFLRPDTNTSGHMQWFYLKIKNQTKTKIKINICNNKKSNTLFQRGMKPYILSSKAQAQKPQGWTQQGCYNITYSKLQLSEQKEQRQNNPFKTYKAENYYKLSFQYDFQHQNDEVSFAYCPPYTFSQLKRYITHLKRFNQENILSEQKFCTSLSGLDIPMLTVTDPSVNNQDKICIFAIGRLHPGQSNGSYAIEGFINYLMSELARQMRKKVIFKIIPMINPDGVIFGNYRTSLSGKDLNRQFKTKSLELIPEIVQLKQLMKKLKYEHKYKVMYFLDFHGHSLKKNVFFYGPEYDIWSLKYQKAKILPKILASKTDMFRLKSCFYKVANFKRTTARAYMLAYIPYCYTIQSSVGCYKNSKNIDIPFTTKDWIFVGYKIGESFSEIVEKMIENANKVIKRKEKKENKTLEQQEYSKDQEVIKSIQKPITAVRSVKYLNPIKNLKKKPIKESIICNTQILKIDEQQCESDKFSEGNSDCQSDDNDLPKNQYEKLKDQIVNVMENFQLLMVGKKNMIFLKKKDRKGGKTNKSKEFLPKKSQEMLLVPSLKHKLTKIILSQKKISFLNTLACQKPSINQYKSKRFHRNTFFLHT